MQNRGYIAERLRFALHNSLKKKFGRRISAQRFADLFNVNAHGTTTISRETARRWIQGDSLPDYGHLAVLIQWLQLDPDDFFSQSKAENSGIVSVDRAFRGDKNSARSEQLFDLFCDLDKDDQNAILAMAQTMRGGTKRWRLG